MADMNVSTISAPDVQLLSSMSESITTSIRSHFITCPKSSFTAILVKGANKQCKNISSRPNSGCIKERRLKPRPKVVIPRFLRDRPLPVLPLFDDAFESHLNLHRTSNAGEIAAISTSASKAVEQPSGPGHTSSDLQEKELPSTCSNQSSKTSTVKESSLGEFEHVVDQFDSGKVLSEDAIPAGSDTPYGFPPSMTPPRKYEHSLLAGQHPLRPTCERQYDRSCSWAQKPTSTLRFSRCERRRSHTLDTGMHTVCKIDIQPTECSSPTSDEAENDPLKQLIPFTSSDDTESISGQSEWMFSAQSEENPFLWDNVLLLREHAAPEASAPSTGIPRKDSCVIKFDNLPFPAIPRRLSRRANTTKKYDFRLSQLPNEISFDAVRSLSQRKANRLTIDSSFRSNIFQPLEPIKREITPVSAEAVILNVYRSLDHLDDLFATALLNRGFYQVFKRHELDLIKSTLRKLSPAAWEFREVAFPGHDNLLAEDLEVTRPKEEYTPTEYLRLHAQDTQIIESIKMHIQVSCQSFVRPEIAFALKSKNTFESIRVDDALWRIWTFCKIFGSGKGREEDVVAQMDWLKGGPLAHQKISFSMMNTDYMNNTLIGAPESFAEGNEGGLTAEQLFDMMELWNCLGVLLRGFEGRTTQAREAGVFDSTEIRGGDIDGEELMLDEWCYHLLTFGLATVLDLTNSYHRSKYSPFELALEKGWTVWQAPIPGSTRRKFLKEAASRVYEDEIADTYAAISTRHIQRQQRKARIQEHITELRRRKNSSKHMPMIRMSQERPISGWDAVITKLTKHPPLPENDIVSYIPALHCAQVKADKFSDSRLPVRRTHLLADMPSSWPGRITAQPLLPSPPSSTVLSVHNPSSPAISISSVRKRFDGRKEEIVSEIPSLSMHPAFCSGAAVPQLPADHPACSPSLIEDLAPVFRQHEAERGIFGSRAFENTAEKAIYRVVEMGFTADQARQALRMTDPGDGLRIDRAIELLLSGVLP